MRISLADRHERGASAAEYAILVSLIAIIILSSVALFGRSTSGLFQKTCESIGSTQGLSC
jgi:Flp pilus assembly pilin Flp